MLDEVPEHKPVKQQWPLDNNLGSDIQKKSDSFASENESDDSYKVAAKKITLQELSIEAPPPPPTTAAIVTPKSGTKRMSPQYKKKLGLHIDVSQTKRISTVVKLGAFNQLQVGKTQALSSPSADLQKKQSW